MHPNHTVKRLLDANRLPHLLLYGPPGTGKTSTILALANQMYGSSRPHMVLELNASDDRGISIVRQEIQDFASSRVLFKYDMARWSESTSQLLTPAAKTSSSWLSWTSVMR